MASASSSESEIDEQLSQKTEKQLNISEIKNIQHLLQHIPADHEYKEKLEQLAKAIPHHYYIPKNNCAAIMKMFHSCLHSFDPKSRLRTRMSHVIVGLKNTGETTLVNYLATALEQIVSDLLIVLVDGRELQDKDLYYFLFVGGKW
jgi:tRNA U34 5-carboxymethylaminomethyl modifying GTPase MnmE/TrmE